MLLVIFGAGASHGSAHPRGQHGTDAQPPLADELLNYPQIAAEYPGSATVVDSVRRFQAERGFQIEDALAQFGTLAERSTDRQQQLIAFRFYLCKVMDFVSRAWIDDTYGQTRYLTLLNYLAEWQEGSQERIHLATFNYDILIESALANVFPDWNFNGLPSYIEGPRWSLLKLHGSITWSRVISSERASGYPPFRRAILEANRFVPTNLPFELSNSVRQQPAPGNVAVPALAVPMTGKTAFECPDDHIEALMTSIPEVKRVLICGWRGAEDHMVEALSGIFPGYLLGIVAHSDEGVAQVHSNLGAADRKAKHVLDEPGGMEALVEDLPGKLGDLLAPWR